MIERMRCLLFGWGCPDRRPLPMPAPELVPEPVIHATYNTRAALRLNAQRAEQLAEREARAARTLADELRDATGSRSFVGNRIADRGGPS